MAEKPDHTDDPLKCGYVTAQPVCKYPSTSPSDMLSGKHQEEQDSRREEIQDLGKRVEAAKDSNAL